MWSGFELGLLLRSSMLALEPRLMTQAPNAVFALLSDVEWVVAGRRRFGRALMRLYSLTGLTGDFRMLLIALSILWYLCCP